MEAFLIGIASNVVTSIAALALLWVKRRWIAKHLQNWKLSGDAWWLACDLHSIKLQAADDRVTKMKDAIKKALEHAHKLRMDD